MTETNSWLDALVRRGLSADDVRECGIRAGNAGAILVPVRDEHGIVRATRCYDAPGRGSRPLDDLGARSARLVGSMGVSEDRIFDATPHVARPPATSQQLPWRKRAVFLVDDEIQAEVVARRLGGIAVAPASETMIEEAAALAVRLAGPHPVVVAFARQRIGVEGSATLWPGRAAHEIDASGGTAVLAVFKPGESVETIVARGEPLKVRPLDPRRIRLARSGGVPAEAIAWLGVVARRWIAALKSHKARRLAARMVPIPALSVEALGPEYRAMLDDLSAVSLIARERGAELIAIGGLAIDLLVGAPVRPRKDADCVLVGASPECADEIVGCLTDRGYRYTRRLPGRTYRLERRPGEMIEIFRSVRKPRGHEIVMSMRRGLFPEDLAEAQSRVLGPLTIRPLRADLLLLSKHAQMGTIYSIFPRSELNGDPQGIFDVAVLQALLGLRHDPAAPARTGEASIRYTGIDLVDPTLHQLRRAVAARVPGFGRRGVSAEVEP